MLELYLQSNPIEGTLQVSDLHTIHFEESGNPQGKPIVLLHGVQVGLPTFINILTPREMAVMFDQRGCGQYPHAELRENTTHLVKDIEKPEGI